MKMLYFVLIVCSRVFTVFDAMVFGIKEHSRDFPGRKTRHVNESSSLYPICAILPF